jgi:hypothetical protein
VVEGSDGARDAERRADEGRIAAGAELLVISRCFGRCRQGGNVVNDGGQGTEARRGEEQERHDRSIDLCFCFVFVFVFVFFFVFFFFSEDPWPLTTDTQIRVYVRTSSAYAYAVYVLRIYYS